MSSKLRTIMKKWCGGPERDRILVEFGKIKGSLKKLWNLAKTEKLDRNECLNTLHEIDRSFTNLMCLCVAPITIGLADINRIEKERRLRRCTKKMLMDVKEEALKVLSDLKKELPLIVTDLQQLISKLENPQISDKEIKSFIINFCKNMGTTIIIPFENSYKIDDKDELLLLAEFASLFPTFTPNWIVAVVYLTAMEITVKKALKKRNKELKNNFKENFQTLLSCLKEEGDGITELERSLPSIFWDIRNKVIHEGYSPEDEELKIIREYITRLIEICI